MEDDASRDAEYPEGYDDSNYADHYQSEIEGAGYAYDASGQQEAQGPNYYDAWYQQQGYSDAYQQQEGQDEATAAAASDAYAASYDYANGYDYQYGYDATAYDPTTIGDGQYYSYYPGGEGDDAEQQSYVNGEDTPMEQQYVDQVARDQASGYYYDEEGNLIDGYGGSESPTNVFKQEAYWELEAYNQTDTSYSGEATSPEIGDESPHDELNAEEQGLAEASPIEADTDGLESSPGLERSPGKVKNPVNDGRAASPSKKKKSKKERMQQRQALLEKEEEERLKAQDDSAAAGGTDTKPGEVSKVATKTRGSPTKISGFVSREKAKFQMKVRIAKAIRRKRMPVQIGILTATRKHLTPLEKYFDSSSIECVLSDIFWASMKGDLGRIRHLVEIEGESATDSTLDPWNLHQTPLHWAAKGGSTPVINYLLAAGASPRTLDENGSLPLHLSCWAGHVDASLLLLRASDAKDLYVQDYDAAMSPLDWANTRSHAKLLKAIKMYEDSLWLPKFVDDLIRGIVRYKIKLFKDPPKKLSRAAAKAAAVDAAATAEAPPTPDPAAQEAVKTEENAEGGTSLVAGGSSTTLTLLKRAKNEKAKRTPGRGDQQTASTKALR